MGMTPHTRPRPLVKDFVSWFEIPVYDIHRAARFYNTIYNIEMRIEINGEFAMAFFPADQGIGGALVAGPGCTPNATGVLIYLNAGRDMNPVLGRVEAAGGRVIMPRTLINESAGTFALFIDSEGNRLALHEGTAGAEAGKAGKPRKARKVGKTRQAGKTTKAGNARKARQAGKATTAGRARKTGKAGRSR